MPREVSRTTVNAVMQQSARLCDGLRSFDACSDTYPGVLRAMLWIRLRFVAVAALAVGIASGGTGFYVCGSQPPASEDQTTGLEAASDHDGTYRQRRLRRRPTTRRSLRRRN